MIIVCSGPDTCRARAKARELTAAFTAKFDPLGLAVETIDGADGIEGIIPRLGASSLFTVKKLIRADGCLSKIKLSEAKLLAEKLQAEKDCTIVLTVEEQEPDGKIIAALKASPLFHYPYPPLSGFEFQKWVRQQGKALGVPERIADTVAEYADGDSWLALQELSKQSANPQTIEKRELKFTGSAFELADAYNFQATGKRKILAEAKDESLYPLIYSQCKSWIRVRDGAVENLHPFVIKKFRKTIMVDAEKKTRKLLSVQFLTRVSLANGNEVEALL